MIIVYIVHLALQLLISFPIGEPESGKASKEFTNMTSGSEERERQLKVTHRESSTQTFTFEHSLSLSLDFHYALSSQHFFFQKSLREINAELHILSLLILSLCPSLSSSFHSSPMNVQVVFRDLIARNSRIIKLDPMSLRSAR